MILLVALLVFKPSELPGLAEALGRFFSRTQRLWQQFKNSLDESP